MSLPHPISPATREQIRSWTQANRYNPLASLASTMNCRQKDFPLTNFMSTTFVTASLLIENATGAASEIRFPNRFLLIVNGSGYSTTMDFAPAKEGMQWHVLMKCVSGATKKQYWATANASGESLKGQIDGRKSQSFVFNSARMSLSLSPGQCRGGKAEIMLGIGE